MELFRTVAEASAAKHLTDGEAVEIGTGAQRYKYQFQYGADVASGSVLGDADLPATNGIFILQTGEMVEILARIGATGAAVVTSGTTASVALPAASRGYRLSARSNSMFVELGGAGVTATTSSPLWLESGESVDISVTAAQTHVAAIQDAGAGELRVTPLN